MRGLWESRKVMLENIWGRRGSIWERRENRKEK